VRQEPTRPSDVRFDVVALEQMSRCLRCGAMVGDERQHREWHAGLSELIKAIEVMITFSG
jgi:hypothetical protein